MTDLVSSGQNYKRRLSEFRYRLAIDAYGVRIGVASNMPEALDELSAAIQDVLPEFSELDPAEPLDHQFLYRRNASGRDSLYKNDESLGVKRTRDYLMDRFASDIRMTAAEYAVDRVFVHAGVVAWKGKAILFPARSFQGKSTLTAELVRRGALYYSDEYAILNADGYVLPFPKKLSIRGEIDAFRQVDHPVEKFGGVAGTEPAPVGMLLITEYKAGARWKPKTLTPGKGVMEVIRHTLPIRRNPKFALDVLGRLARSAPIIQSRRGEVGEAAAQILEYFESHCLGERPDQLEATS